MNPTTPQKPNGSLLEPFARHYKCSPFPLEFFGFGTLGDSVHLPAGSGSIVWRMDSQSGAASWHERARGEDCLAGEVPESARTIIATDVLGVWVRLLALAQAYPADQMAAVYFPARGAWTKEAADAKLWKPGARLHCLGSPGLLRRLDALGLPGLSAVEDRGGRLLASADLAEIRQVLEAITGGAKPAREADLPIVYLPKEEKHKLNECARDLAMLMRGSGSYYRKGGYPVTIEGKTADGRPALKILTPPAASGHFERLARLCRQDRHGRDQIAICRKDDAELILSSPSMDLPEINSILPCAILSEDRAGKLRLIQGYDEGTRCYASGPNLPEVSLEEAVTTLKDFLGDFHFASDGDRSRALASTLSPAFIFSGLLGNARAPVELAEADGSQAGKGYRLRVTASLYGMDFCTVTQREKSGVGSVKESFDQACYEGHAAIQFDNWRGSLDYPWLEAFCTEPSYSARPFGQSAVTLDPRRHWLAITTNKAEPTLDLANRMNIVRIVKRPIDYVFKGYGEGGKLKLDEWVQQNQPYYLACVYAVVRAWHAAGKPRTTISRGDSFTRWAQIMDWIAIEIFGWSSIMDGHAEAKARLVNPSLQWLRSVILAAKKHHLAEGRITAGKILELAQEEEFDIKGVKMDRVEESDDRRKAALIAIGRELGKLFKVQAEYVMDGVAISYARVYSDELRREENVYSIRYLAPLPSATPAPAAAAAQAAAVPEEPTARSVQPHRASSPSHPPHHAPPHLPQHRSNSTPSSAPPGWPAGTDPEDVF